MKSRFLIACAMSISLALPASAQQAGKQIVLAESTPYVATSNAVQNFTQSIDLAKGQEKLALILTYYNGLNGKPGFRWIRINSSAMSYFTEKDFGGKNLVNHDVTGDLGPGGNQLIIQAGGVAGSVFAWRLTTTQPAISSVVPPNPAPGETFVVKGTNFSTDASSDIGIFNGTNIPAISATSGTITFRIPEDVQPGDGQFHLKVAGLDAGTIPMQFIIVTPYLTSLSAPWAPPGGTLTINGRGFAPSLTGNTVTIGPYECPVQSASATSITVTTPWQYQALNWGMHVPVKVISGGVRASNQLIVSVYTAVEVPGNLPTNP
jgi:hypothetical protein